MAAQQFQVWLEWDQEDKVWVTYVPTSIFFLPMASREEALSTPGKPFWATLEAAAKEGIPVEIKPQMQSLSGSRLLSNAPLATSER